MSLYNIYKTVFIQKQSLCDLNSDINLNTYYRGFDLKMKFKCFSFFHRPLILILEISENINASSILY